MKDFRIALRVRGPTVNPRDITNLVGLSPTNSFSVGDIVSLRSPSGHRRKHGLWSLSVEGSNPGDFSNRLLELVRKIPPGVLKNDPSCDLSVDVFVGLFGIRDQSTLTIEPAVHKELGLREWAIVFDMYVESSKDDT